MAISVIENASFGNSGIVTANGIKFPATQASSADANTLDDYEEGTWTPLISPITGSITTSSASGKYTKIGNVVTLWYFIVITTSGTASGKLQILGAPFIANYDTSIAQPSGLTRESASTGNIYFTYIIGGDTLLFIQNSTNGGVGWGNGYCYSGIITYQSA
jgi:hypothetical protein